MRVLNAAVLKEANGTLEIFKSIETPPLKDYQVLVKIYFSGVCRSQVMEVDGCRGTDVWLPHMLGHEASGKVVAVGSKVEKLSVGDLVVATWIQSAGGDSGGCNYSYRGQTINSGSITTFSNYSIISENRLVKLDPRVPLDLAVTLGCAVPTGAGLIYNEIGNKKDKSIVIFGLGGIGLSALLAARNFEFSKIIVVDIDEKKLSLARKIGAHSVINASSVNPVKAIIEATVDGADYCIDASGICSVIEQAFSSSKPATGITIFASHPPYGEKLSIDPHDLIKGRKIFGSWGGASEPDRDVEMYSRLYLEGRFDLSVLIDKIYKFEEINLAISDLRAGKCLRPVIQMDEH